MAEMLAESSEVEVWIYDLSGGVARSMSLALLGKQIDGIWHTSIVVYGQEYFFGGDSIECCVPGGTILGQPKSKVKLGRTEIPYGMFHEHLRELSQTCFRPCDYHLLNRNCNNFSSEIAQFLTGNDIPAYITNLPSEVLNTPFGQMISPMLNSMTVNPGGAAHKVFGESAPSHRILSPSGPKTPAAPSTSVSNPSEPKTPAAPSTSVSSSPSKECVTYTCAQIPSVDDICDKSSLTSHQRTLASELVNYVGADNPQWSVSPAHVKFIGSLLESSQDSTVRVAHIWTLLQRLAIKPQALPMLRKSSFVNHLMVSNVHALKMLCNLTSSVDGYKLCVLAKRCVLEELPTALTSDEDADYKACALSAMLNVSVHHRLEDELDINYTCSLVEFVTADVERSLHQVELALKALLNLMSKNMEMKLLAFTMGLDVEKYSSQSQTDKQSESLTQVLKSLTDLQMN